MAVGLCGCFTGVEGTGKINLSKKDIVASAPTLEEKFLADIQPTYLKEWTEGKAFFIADDKFRLITENIEGTPVTKGDTLFFNHSEARVGADGGEKTLIIFTKNIVGKKGTTGFLIEKAVEDAMDSFSSSEVSMAIDLDIVNEIGSKLIGKTLWTKTASWFEIGNTDNMRHKKGKKFIPVTITGVSPGNAFFPLAIIFRDPEGENGLLLMNIGNSSNDSRSFGKLFSLTDPKNSYRQITTENWEAIQNEQVRVGMTKEEAKLSLGNPSDIDTGHNYSSAVEIWYYPDGRYLRFVDGLLVGN